MLLKAVEAGVDIVDACVSSMSGLTSQPSLNGLIASLNHTERDTGLSLDAFNKLSDYWEDVRPFYQGFESGMKASNTEVYVHEMPGGQYTNLEQQAKAVGLEGRWEEVKHMYAIVNQMCGDIVKVTPSSKVVGDLALFMVQNNLNEENIWEKGTRLDFPDSVIQFFQGYLGQPPGGFPKQLQELVLKGRDAFTARPGELLAPVNFEAVESELEEKIGREPSELDVLSYIMYPQVYLQFDQRMKEYGDLSVLNTSTFFYGLRPGEETAITIERGKTLIIKLVAIGELHPDGRRIIYFELNGQPREIFIRDQSAIVSELARRKADSQNATHLGASMPGKVLKVLVAEGDKVRKGEHLLVSEAMKMETTIQAPMDGKIKAVYVKAGEAIETGDLLIEME